MITLYLPNSEKPLKWQSSVDLFTSLTNQRDKINYKINNQTRCKSKSTPIFVENFQQILPVYYLNENFSGRLLYNSLKY